MSKISAQNVSKVFVEGTKKTSVLDGISFEFQSNASYAITGASGSGKSTLLHILGGLDVPTSGEVIVDDKVISQFKPQEKVAFFF